jgi:hypothetical protein
MKILDKQRAWKTYFENNYFSIKIKMEMDQQMTVHTTTMTPPIAQSIDHLANDETENPFIDLVNQFEKSLKVKPSTLQ